MTLELAKKLPDSIKTNRLILRAPNLTDAPAIHRLANNKAIHKFLSSLPFPYTRAHAIDFISNIARAKNEHAYALITKNEELIGIMGWHLNRELGPELGYWIGEPFWGKGYATEAALALVESALNAGHKTLIARAITTNPGSIRVLEKAGFAKISEGVDDCGIHKGVHMGVFRWEQTDG